MVVALTVSAACGKKGPPLAPLVPIPAAVEVIDAERLGSDVYVSLTIPEANVDEFAPADLGRVEIYGYTGRSAPPRPRWVELAALVATVPVAPPPPRPGEEPDPSSTPPQPSIAPAQGSQITIREMLTPDELAQGKEAAAVTPATTSRVRDDVVLKRFYTAVPFNTKGRPGPPGEVAEFPLLPAPAPPPSITATYAERAIRLTWEPAGGLIGFLLERALPEEPLPFAADDDEDQTLTPDTGGPLLYNVYREIPPDPMDHPGPAVDARWREAPPAPITAVPVATLGFTDNIEFGRRRCYTVRAVRGTGPDARVGDASPPVCLTPIDTFAPAPPTSLATVASEGVISLIWEPSGELDLGGYVVLRGEAPGDTLTPLTAAPVTDARYRDDTVKPGVRYVYAVIAVDNRLPVPNMSPESNHVEETAR